MTISNIVHLYRVRLRARLLQECFAIVGIAAGVALLFASQVASSSLSSAVGQLNSGVVGNARLQLTARGPQGFEERLLGQVRHLPGVRVAAPLLETDANALGPAGGESVTLVGADSSLAELDGALVRHVTVTPFAGLGAIVLPAPVAHTLGVTKFGQSITFEIDGHVAPAALYSRLDERQIGSLIDSPIAVAPLAYAQELTGLHGRISRILVEPAPGQLARVAAGLRRLAGNRLNVEAADYDEKLFARAATATNQSTALFAVISALVGFLFAFNAMLLTVPQRRRLIADLRRDGYPPAAVIAILLFDAVVLGAIASALGLALGDELSIHLFNATPGYLSAAFAVGSQRVVTWQNVAIAVGGGMLAACVAVLSPFRDIVSRDPLAAITPRVGSARGMTASLLAGGLTCLGVTLAILLAAPREAILGMVTLIAALLLLLPIPLNATLALVRRIAPKITSAVPHIAVMELRSGRARAVAIAATGAVAVFGSVSIQGAHGDLLNGLDNASRETNSLTDVWVYPAGSFNLLLSAPFQPTARGELERLPGVRAVRLYRGGLLDYGDRRIWVSAPARAASPLIPPGQLIEGNHTLAEARLRGGGWVVVSRAIAEEHHLHIGQPFNLPSPDPRTYRVAAISTNFGWAPGAILLNADDYARAWGSDEISAYNVLLARGVTPEQGRREVERSLGSGSGLTVRTARQRVVQVRGITRQGLARLSQIATLIIIAAILAMAAAMGAMIWQRRPRLAKLKLEGFSPNELWRTILLESVLLLGVGCCSGAVLGLFGQQLLDHALGNVIDFPVAYSVGVRVALLSVALVTAAAVLIVAAPGYFAARVPAELALQD